MTVFTYMCQKGDVCQDRSNFFTVQIIVNEAFIKEQDQMNLDL